MRFGIYAATSLLAGAGLVGYTYYTRQQFYPTVIYLVTSKVSVMVLCNVAFVMTVLFGQVFKRIFLGTLRDAEMEMLYDHARFAIAETCFTLSVFREEMSLRVLGLFTILLFLKTFHWLCQWRGEHIEQSEVVSRITHVRLVLLMALLAAVDMIFVIVSGLQVAERGPSVLVLFGFEFLILFVTLVAVFLRYILHLIDARVEGTWTNKFTYVFYLELVTEIVKLIVYLIFFMIIFTYYGMPLHLLRDLWMSIQNLQRRIVAYFRYRRITANMNERFPNPTEEEMNETDRICIICREEMTLETAKKLPCTHIFHLNCLRMWLQRQQSCPTCRSNIPIDVNSARPEDTPEANIPPRGGVNPPPPQGQAQEQNNPPLQPEAPAPQQPQAQPPRRENPQRNLPGFGQSPAQLQQTPAPATTPASSMQPTAPPPTQSLPPAGAHAPPHGTPQAHSTHPGLGVPPFPATTAPVFGATHFDPAAADSSAHYIQSLHYALQLDPRFLQYQLDMLQAQLHVLRATSLALHSQSGFAPMPGFPASVPTGAVPPPFGVFQPPSSLNQVPVPEAVPASAPPAPVAAPPTTTNSISVPAAAQTPTLSPVPSTPGQEFPVPSTPALPHVREPEGQDVTVPSTRFNHLSTEQVAAQADVASEVPPAPVVPLTPEEIERDRRREELRRIYAKRYGNSSEAVDEE
ncbi:hypothetical protein H310_01419 [Aphanomyces invadans]|uniref:RING-type E3 ubiquitin transferase n=1 Tax=Aphanomyces invadans TaxID=157072 RepID=A0A024USR2_9STRA|nr:hypothetical protein H310_01419 [Aphanomyces invadans]ETW08937.1 hypothetical protein H310_01419 [Aphanomyces invadans]|eukprot:XP_008862742.1 hypothetical protein H310_01419 [Aphanomyces invadans]